VLLRYRKALNCKTYQGAHPTKADQHEQQHNVRRNIINDQINETVTRMPVSSGD
jgi:hypothetical protein